MLLAISQRPPHFRRVGFRPPSIQDRQIDTAVDEHFHSAGSARLPWPPRRIEPDVHSPDQLLGQLHIVVAKEDHGSARTGAANEMGPLPNQGLARLIGRMGLACHDELHRALRIIQQPQQPLRIVQQQIRSFVGCETARKTQDQGVRVEQALRRFSGVRQRPRYG